MTAPPRHLTRDEQEMLVRALRASAKRVDRPSAEPPAQDADALLRDLQTIGTDYAGDSIVDETCRAAVAIIKQQAREPAARDDERVILLRRARKAESELAAARADVEAARNALTVFMDFAGRLRTMSDEELESWRVAALDAAKGAK